MGWLMAWQVRGRYLESCSCDRVCPCPPPLMADGAWRVGVVMDAAASQEQAEKLGAVFAGQLGGPMARLGPLISEMLGVQLAPID